MHIPITISNHQQQSKVKLTIEVLIGIEAKAKLVEIDCSQV